jgi:hypothetical protein
MASYELEKIKEVVCVMCHKPQQRRPYTEAQSGTCTEKLECVCRSGLKLGVGEKKKKNADAHEFFATSASSPSARFT